MPRTVSLVALIVDSDLMIRAHIIERFNKHGIECLEAGDGLAALESLENNQVDFVISDVHLKKMDGIQFIEVLHRSYKDIPVVATLGAGDDEAIISAFRAGAVNVIKKVDNLNELEQIVLPITNLIEKRKATTFDLSNVRYFSEELNVENDPSLIPVIVQHMFTFLHQTKYSPRLTGLEVALYEMIANAIEHGNLEISSAEKEKALSENRYNQFLEERRNNPEFKDRTVKIKLNYNSRQLTFTIIDQGNGFNVEVFKTPTEESLLAQSGRGVFMSKMYCDEILYSDKGNKVTLILKSETESHQEGIVHAQVHQIPIPHILIVDNNQQMLRHISNLLKEMGYTYGYIAHAAHLFPRLEEESFDLILLDINMPNTDGVSLITEMQEHTLYKSIPVIGMTSKRNDRLMAECLNVGADDFILKPVNQVTLKSRIRSALAKRESYRQIGQVNEQLEQLNNQLQTNYDVLNKTQAELKENHRQIEDDIRLAERIQRYILSPQIDLPFVHSSLLFKPHSIVSGDYYYLDTDQSGNLNVFIGDATGHGVSAAFLTMMVRMALGMTDNLLPPEEIVRSLNRQLADCVPRGNYMTGLMLKIESNGQMTGCGAGNPHCLVVTPDCSRPAEFGTPGQALGMFSEERVPYQNERYQLNSGDRVLLFTDGILEWRNQKSQPYGIESVKRFFFDHREDSLEDLLQGLMADAKEFTHPQPQHDDITILALQFR